MSEWRLSEQDRLWKMAEDGYPEKAYMETCEYVGMYHMSGDHKLRDEYAKLARAIGEELMPKAGIASPEFRYRGKTVGLPKKGASSGRMR